MYPVLGETLERCHSRRPGAWRRTNAMFRKTPLHYVFHPRTTSRVAFNFTEHHVNWKTKEITLRIIKAFLLFLFSFATPFMFTTELLFLSNINLKIAQINSIIRWTSCLPLDLYVIYPPYTYSVLVCTTKGITILPF